jgi:hypothetical protein
MSTIKSRQSTTSYPAKVVKAKDVPAETKVFDRSLDNVYFPTALPLLGSDRMTILNIGHRKDLKATFEKPVVVQNLQANDYGKLRMRIKVDDKALMALYQLHEKVTKHYSGNDLVTVREPAFNDVIEIGFPTQTQYSLAEVWACYDGKEELWNAEMLSSNVEASQPLKMGVRMGIYCIPKEDHYRLGYFFTLERVEL